MIPTPQSGACELQPLRSSWRRGFIVFVISLFILGAIFGWRRLSFDVDLSRLLPPSMPETVGYRLLLKNFSPRDELILLVSSKEANVTQTASEAIINYLHTQPQLTPRVISQGIDAEGEAISELVAYAFLNQTPADFRAWAQSLQPGQIEARLEAQLEKLATVLSAEEGWLGYDPLGLAAPLAMSFQAGRASGASEFMSADGTRRLLYVQTPKTFSNYHETASWIAEVRRTLDPIVNSHGAKLKLTGEPAFVAEISLSMERDMKFSGLTTLLLTGLVIWLVFRRFRFVPCLLLCLSAVFALTLGWCGLLLGSLTALTVGFASILIGLSADYGVLVYAAARRGERDTTQQTRVRRSVWWAAATTAVSFGALWPLGVPGLSELGAVVALGVVIGAVVMLHVFPRLLRFFRGWPAAELTVVSPAPAKTLSPRIMKILALSVAFSLVLAVAGVVMRGPPRVDPQAGSMRPAQSEAYETMEDIESHFFTAHSAQTQSLIVTGPDEASVAVSLAQIEKSLRREKEQSSSDVSYTLPTALWPQSEHQRVNLSQSVPALLSAQSSYRQAILNAGFAKEALTLTDAVWTHWQRWLAAGTIPVCLTHPSLQRMLSRVICLRTQEADPQRRYAALGLVQLPPEMIARVKSNLPPGSFFTGRLLLDEVMDRFIRTAFWPLALLFSLLTLVLLAWAVRDWRSLLLVALMISLSFTALIGAMSWLGLTWNAFTLPALLLSLGTGSDYFIHVILDLKNHRALDGLHQRLFRPLLLCASTSAIGFGSLLWANSTGLANLGLVCALALIFNAITALGLMPWLWQKIQPPAP